MTIPDKSSVKPKSLQFADESIVYAVNQPLLLEASAGSGKTTVLVERYIACILYRLLFEEKAVPVYEAVQSAVALTFTRKAASEMKDRVRRRMKAILQREVLEDVIDRIAKYTGADAETAFRRIDWIVDSSEEILSALNSAPVSTIHSFGLNLLRAHSVESGLDPLSSPEDGSGISELSITSKDALYQTIRALIDGRDPDFSFVVEAVGFKKARDLLEEIFRRADAIGFERLEYFLKKAGYLDSGHGMNIVQIVEETIKPALKRLQDKLIELLPLHRKSEATIRRALDKVDKLLSRGLPAECFGSDVCYDGKGAALNEIAPHYEAYYHLLHKVFFPKLWKSFVQFNINYEKLKIRRKEITFTDIEQRLIKTLSNNKEFRRKVQSGLCYLLIDEYQDTSDIQKELFDYLIYGDGGRIMTVPFAVGDPKQSIYGFRNANVDIFYKTREEFLKLSQASVKELNSNYRSDRRVVQAVNEIFADVFSQGQMEYRDQEAVRESDDGKCGTYFIPEEGEKAGEVFESNCVKAAGIIRMMIEKEGYQPSDILVLLRKTTSIEVLNREFERILGAAQIPFLNIDTENVLESDEIKNLLIYLRALENPESDHFFLPLLKSPFFRKNDSEILSLKRKGSTLYQAVSQTPSPEVELFKFFQDKKNHLIIPDLVGEIAQRTGYSAFLNTLPNSREASTAMVVFQDFLRRIQDIEMFRLTDFIYYLEEYGVQLKRPQIVGEKSNVVRVLTVHGAKGLESRAVFYLSTRAQRNGTDEFLATNESVGINVFGADKDFARLADELELKEQEEERRLAYVAFTRARDRFYYIGTGNIADRNENGKKLSPDEKDGQDGWKKFINIKKDFVGQRLLADHSCEESSGKNVQTDENLNSRVADRAAYLKANLDKVKTRNYPLIITVTQLLDIEFLGTGFRNRYIYKSFPVDETLTKIAEEEDDFLSENSRADEGTFLHKVFQYSTARNYTEYIESALEFEADRLKEKKDSLLSKSRQFFQSQFYKEILQTGITQQAEWEVNYPYHSDGARVLIKGSIDRRIVLPDGKAVLVDYKLSVHGEDKRYERQLNYYAYILDKIGYSADELFLYDIEANQLIAVEKNTKDIPRLLKKNLENIIREFDG